MILRIRFDAILHLWSHQPKRQVLQTDAQRIVSNYSSRNSLSESLHVFVFLFHSFQNGGLWENRLNMSQAIMLFGLWLGGSDQSDVSVLVVPPSHSLCILRGCKQYRINLPLLQKFLRGVNCSHQAMQGPRQHNHPREQSLFCHQDVGVKERPGKEMPIQC